MFTNRPTPKGREVAMQLDIEVPDALFQKPTLQATITIDHDIPVAQVLSAEVVEVAQDAIAQATGLQFAVSVVESGEGDQQ